MTKSIFPGNLIKHALNNHCTNRRLHMVSIDIWIVSGFVCSHDYSLSNILMLTLLCNTMFYFMYLSVSYKHHWRSILCARRLVKRVRFSMWQKSFTIKFNLNLIKLQYGIDAGGLCPDHVHLLIKIIISWHVQIGGITTINRWT